ncbi:MAG TPA: LUD domain-containing protein [Cytophagaceae bacterium]
MSQTNSRDNIFRKIRQALSNKGSSMPEPNFTQPIYSKPEEKDLTVVFAENFVKNKGEFFYCENEMEFFKAFHLFLKTKGLEKVYTWEKDLIKFLEEGDIKTLTSDSNFTNAQAGVTTCESLIARTGSILVSSGSESGRRLGIFPHAHIIIAFSSQIVEDIKDGFAVLSKRYKKDLPSMISLETGPSRTADIEKTLVLGAHGPKDLILFLIDDTSA